MRLDVRGAYPGDWKAVAAAVKDAAGWRCVRCGHGNDTPKLRQPCDERCSHPADGKQRMLTVHHLDGDKANCRWWNLLALCQACHLKVQGKVIPERPWFLDHSPWFVPYVCGFYAWYYGRQEITRAEADAEPERWLGLGQPWRTATGEPTADHRAGLATARRLVEHRKLDAESKERRHA